MTSGLSTGVGTLLGFARRAGKVASGREAVWAVLQKKRAHLILVAQDAPEKLQELFQREGERLKVPVRVYGQKAELGLAIGQSPRSIVAVLSLEFAEGITKKIDGAAKTEDAACPGVDGGDR